MNKEHIRFHLQEASDALSEILSGVNDEDFFELDFSLSLQHLYYHLNSAWNAREATDEQLDECSDKNFAMWRMYPADIPLMDEYSS